MGVIPSSAILGRSRLYVLSQRVAKAWTSAMGSNRYWPPPVVTYCAVVALHVGVLLRVAGPDILDPYPSAFGQMDKRRTDLLRTIIAADCPPPFQVHPVLEVSGWWICRYSTHRQGRYAGREAPPRSSFRPLGTISFVTRTIGGMPVAHLGHFSRVGVFGGTIDNLHVIRHIAQHAR
jgi:hypothetical protein